MDKLNYSELAFIENALTYFRIHEVEIMENSGVYSFDEILEFGESVEELIYKISKIKEGE